MSRQKCLSPQLSHFLATAAVSAYDRGADRCRRNTFLPIGSTRFLEQSLMTTEPDPSSLLATYRVVIALPVFWGDQDAFGHVNNNAYFRWFESARIAYSERIGLLDLFRTAADRPDSGIDRLRLPSPAHLSRHGPRGRARDADRPDQPGPRACDCQPEPVSGRGRGNVDDRRFRLSRQPAASRSAVDSPGYLRPGGAHASNEVRSATAMETKRSHWIECRDDQTLVVHGNGAIPPGGLRSQVRAIETIGISSVRPSWSCVHLVAFQLSRTLRFRRKGNLIVGHSLWTIRATSRPPNHSRTMTPHVSIITRHRACSETRGDALGLACPRAESLAPHLASGRRGCVATNAEGC